MSRPKQDILRCIHNKLRVPARCPESRKNQFSCIEGAIKYIVNRMNEETLRQTVYEQLLYDAKECPEGIEWIENKYGIKVMDD